MRRANEPSVLELTEIVGNLSAGQLKPLHNFCDGSIATLEQIRVDFLLSFCKLRRRTVLPRLKKLSYFVLLHVHRRAPNNHSKLEALIYKLQRRQTGLPHGLLSLKNTVPFTLNHPGTIRNLSKFTNFIEGRINRSFAPRLSKVGSSHSP